MAGGGGNVTAAPINNVRPPCAPFGQPEVNLLHNFSSIKRHFLSPSSLRSAVSSVICQELAILTHGVSSLTVVTKWHGGVTSSPVASCRIDKLLVRYRSSLQYYI